MKKLTILFSVCIVAVITLSSFKPVKPVAVNYGTYGVCNCSDDTQKTVGIALTINNDNTFHYINSTNPTKKVDLTGKWEMKGNSIVLVDYKSDTPIHSKWVIDKNYPCLKSRLGMNWTRLCFLKPCK